MSVEELARDCDVCKEWLSKNYDSYDDKLAAMVKDTQEHMLHMREAHKEVKRRQFAFTFTTNKSREEIEKPMIESCYKLYRQQTCPIREGEAYLEYTEEGRPHIHGWYETEDGGRVFAKVFARCWPAWKEKRGVTKFAGGYHEQMKTNRYKGYASAEERVICIKKINELLVYNAPSEADPSPSCPHDNSPSS